MAEDELLTRIEQLEATVKELRGQQGDQAPPAVKAELTIADIRNMTVNEINKRWNEVQAALQKSKKGQ
jgi:hypothetical protein